MTSREKSKQCINQSTLHASRFTMLTGRQASCGKRGTTLLDVLVGIGLLLVVFLSIFGAFKLAIELVVNTKAKTGALALANEQMEYIRSFPYDDVGTVGGIPAGNIEQEETIVLNNTTYTRRTFVQFVDAEDDGVGALDSNGITADFKRAKVELRWNIREEERTFSLVTNIVPRGVESIAGGGTLTVNVINALAAPVEGASVTIVNASTNPAIDVETFSSAQGIASFPGAPAATNYEIVVTSTNMSTAQTYDATAGNPNPNPGHLTVVEGDTTSVTFAIDTLASKTVRTFEPVEQENFEDLFNNTAGIATSTDIVVVGGEAVLVNSGGYVPRGELRSITVTPTAISAWENFSWISQTPASTTITYQLYYEDGGSNIVLVPDSALPGNAAGFSSGPLDLSGLSTTTYQNLVLGAVLETSDGAVTPRLDSWMLTYQNGPEPIPNISFRMRGDKTIGTDGGGLPIYKYEQNLSTDGAGTITISNLEWDIYTITIDNAAIGYDISESCEPQPRGIAPGAVVTTDLTLVPNTAHSLLVSVTDDQGAMIPAASVRLTRTGFDTTQTTSGCGQTFFSALSSSGTGGDYTLEVSASGFQTQIINNVEVDGPSNNAVVLIAL